MIRNGKRDVYLDHNGRFILGEALRTLNPEPQFGRAGPSPALASPARRAKPGRSWRVIEPNTLNVLVNKPVSWPSSDGSNRLTISGAGYAKKSVYAMDISGQHYEMCNIWKTLQARSY